MDHSLFEYRKDPGGVRLAVGAEQDDGRSDLMSGSENRQRLPSEINPHPRRAGCDPAVIR